MKVIEFRHQKGLGKTNCRVEEFEFEDEDTDEDIRLSFEDWVWEQIGDDFSWSVK